ncbi:unnamed protein product [Toxocara canis]|uniref:Uncharacterized protein n=1 Tax=Toxocara canis TaxID=6265 RepID=A0A3P7GFZ8_TOXCA|nr:unnamed protein product [Toxocara canis]
MSGRKQFISDGWNNKSRKHTANEPWKIDMLQGLNNMLEKNGDSALSFQIDQPALSHQKEESIAEETVEEESRNLYSSITPETQKQPDETTNSNAQTYDTMPESTVSRNQHTTYTEHPTHQKSTLQSTQGRDERSGYTDTTEKYHTSIPASIEGTITVTHGTEAQPGGSSTTDRIPETSSSTPTDSSKIYTSPPIAKDASATTLSTNGHVSGTASAPGEGTITFTYGTEAQPGGTSITDRIPETISSTPTDSTKMYTSPPIASYASATTRSTNGHVSDTASETRATMFQERKLRRQHVDFGSESLLHEIGTSRNTPRRDEASGFTDISEKHPTSTVAPSEKTETITHEFQELSDDGTTRSLLMTSPSATKSQPVTTSSPTTMSRQLTTSLTTELQPPMASPTTNSSSPMASSATTSEPLKGSLITELESLMLSPTSEPNNFADTKPMDKLGSNHSSHETPASDRKFNDTLIFTSPTSNQDLNSIYFWGKVLKFAIEANVYFKTLQEMEFNRVAMAERQTNYDAEENSVATLDMKSFYDLKL